MQIEGTTAPNAHITAAGKETTSDANGHFQLSGLPAGDLQVWAYKDNDFGGAPAKAPLIIELKPQTLQPRDAALSHEIWSDIVTETQGASKSKTYYSLPWVKRHLAAQEDDFATQLATTTDDRAIIGLAERFAGKVDLPTLETALNRIKDADTRTYAYLDAATKSGDKALATRALEEAETTFKSPEKESWWREFNLYGAAPVALQVGGEKAGFEMLDRAITYTLKNHGPKSTRHNGMPDQTGRDEMMGLAAERVAEGGTALLRRLLQNIEPGTGYDVMALAQAIPVLAKKDGAESVLPLLDELEKMTAPENREDTQRADQQPQWAFAQAATKVIPLMGKTPEKALALARRVRDETYGNEMKWQALAGAAKFQNAETAARLWREIVGSASAQSASATRRRPLNSTHNWGENCSP